MSSILEIIELTTRDRRPAAKDGDRRHRPDPISDACRALLEEAAALGLDLDDVLEAVRRCAAPSNPSR